ncbi:hypothetical protein AAFF_G00399460 [Aldrovandia affinis]|uniref:Uncharacterized protein n=1 Tax=Aldrovandia affinis TaxID=143900 RepID=A0AAD7SDC8_9TELE|nr:hypothetical protein AAFF_G00399460 [Aldrovandia affinis]
MSWDTQGRKYTEYCTPAPVFKRCAPPLPQAQAEGTFPLTRYLLGDERICLVDEISSQQGPTAAPPAVLGGWEQRSLFRSVPGLPPLDEGQPIEL